MPARHFRRLICAVMAVCLLCACAQSAGAATAETAESAGRPAASARHTGTHSATGETATGETATGESAGAAPTVLPKTADAGRAYLDSTLFIGDSNTARYMMYADDTGTAFTSVNNTIGVVSMGSGAITSLKCERFKGYKDAYTIPDAVAMLKPQRIIIGFGTNDLAGYSAENYIKTYRKGLEAIAKAWEYGDIIICAVPPLDQQRENTNLTMKKVDAFNTALTEMCEEDGYYFLDTAETLKDAKSGWAKKDYTLSDGVHLSKIAVSALFEYIRTHALTTADRRPEDLGKLPVPDGVPPGLIQKDPIAVRGAKVPVEFVAGKGGKLSGATSQNVKKGGTCSTVTAIPDEGWAFDYWTASIGSVGGGASLTFTVPASADANGVIITAHFTPAEHEHNYVEIEGTRVAPTCQQEGSAAYKCSICGAETEKVLAKVPHTTQTNADGSVVCTVCGQVLQQHTHNFSQLISNTATCAPGKATWQCSCGQTKIVDSSPVRDHTWGGFSPNGDGTESRKCSTCGKVETRNVEVVVPDPGGTGGEVVDPAPSDPTPSPSPDTSTEIPPSPSVEEIPPESPPPSETPTDPSPQPQPEPGQESEPEAGTEVTP